MQNQQDNITTALAPLAEQAETIVISDQKSLTEATEILSRLNHFNDQIEDESNKVLAPLKEAMSAEKARWKPAITYYKAGIEAIRLKIATYQTNLTNSLKAKEQAITDRIGQGKGKLSVDTAISKLEALPTIQKTTSTEAGTVQFREKQTLKVTDITKITINYFDLNEARLLADLKLGKLIPGAEIEIIQVPVNYR